MGPMQGSRWSLGMLRQLNSFDETTRYGATRAEGALRLLRYRRVFLWEGVFFFAATKSNLSRFRYEWHFSI